MKRIASEGSFLPQTRPRQDRPILSARALTKEGGLVSLAEPVTGREGVSLTQVLHEMQLQAQEKIQQSKTTPMGGGQEATTEHAALCAIFILDQSDWNDQLTHMDTTTCCHAAQVLMNLGQARLLCRLAEVSQCDLTLTIRDAQNANVLQRSTPDWPRDVPLTIMLTTSLSAAAVHMLHAFLEQPSRLSVTLDIDGSEGPLTVQTFAEALQLRVLEELRLMVHTFANELVAPDVLTGLTGVRAQKITLQMPSRYVENAVVEAALATWVAQSGATKLAFSAPPTGAALAVRLLAGRRDWDVVSLALDDASIKAWLDSKQYRVGTLEIYALQSPVGDASRSVGKLRDFLGSLAESGVHTYTRYGAQDLVVFAEALAQHAAISTHVFDRITTVFTLTPSCTPREIERAVTSLASNLGIVSIVHFTTYPKPLNALNAAHVARLNGITENNRVASPAQRIERDQQMRKRRQAGVERLLPILLRNGSSVEVLNFLAGANNGLCAPINLSNDQSHASLKMPFGTTGERVRLLVQAGLPHDLIRHIVSLWLPDANHVQRVEITRALIRVRLPPQARKTQAWATLGALTHAQAIRTKIKAENSIFFVPPPHADPNAPAKPKNQAPKPATDVPNPSVRVNKNSSTLLPRSEQLLAPPGATTRIAVVARMRARLAGMANNGALPGAAQAIPLIITFLERETFDAAGAQALAVSVAQSISHELIADGQGGVLAHFVKLAPRYWPICALTPQATATLHTLSDWPEDPLCECGLELTTALPVEAMVNAVAFAKNVKPNQLTLLIQLAPNADQAVWNALKEFILSRQGIQLALFSPTHLDRPNALQLQNMTDFLMGIADATFKRVVLSSFYVTDKKLLEALGNMLKSANVPILDLVSASPAAAQTVLTCRPWDSVAATPSAAMARLCDDGRVTAKKLVLRVPQQNTVHEFWVESIVGGCKELEDLRIVGSPINYLSLARALKPTIAVRSVAATIVRRSDALESTAAFEVFRRNTSLVHIEHTNETLSDPAQHIITTQEMTGLARLMTANRLGKPALAAIGAGRGLGWTIGQRFAQGSIFVDGFGNIGPHLDPKSALALASTNKAAYVAWRTPFDIEIDRLGALLDIEDETEFRQKLSVQLKGLSDQFPSFAHTPSTAAHIDDPFIVRCIAMREAGIPRLVVAHALVRKLATAPQSIEAMGLALGWLGAVEINAWLESWLNIDLEAKA